MIDTYRYKFLQIDIENYYSSVNEIIFNKALSYTMRKVDMKFEEIKVRYKYKLLARKTLEIAWIFPWNSGLCSSHRSSRNLSITRIRV